MKPAALMGRQVAAYEVDQDRTVHAVADTVTNYNKSDAAICGRRPASGSSGWAVTLRHAPSIYGVTCAKCADRVWIIVVVNLAELGFGNLDALELDAANRRIFFGDCPESFAKKRQAQSWADLLNTSAARVKGARYEAKPLADVSRNVSRETLAA